MKTKATYLGLIALVALLDQLTKAWARQSLRLPDGTAGPPIPVWTGSWQGNTQTWFEFKFTTNPGAAWGIFGEHTLVLAALSAVMIVVIGLVLLRAKAEERLLSVSLAMMLGGAFGNLIDRLMHQEVTDFFHAFLPIGPPLESLAKATNWGWLHEQVARNMPGGIYDFPIFNVADSSVVVGTCLLLIALSQPPAEERAKASAPVEAAEPTDEPPLAEPAA